jgi:hypothetical protein
MRRMIINEKFEKFGLQMASNSCLVEQSPPHIAVKH